MKFKSMGLVIVFLTLTACSHKIESGTKVGTPIPVNDSGKIPEPAPPAPVPAPAFDYKRFYNETSGVCGESSYYFKLLKAEEVLLGQREGQDILVESTIQLYADKRFDVEYFERYIIAYTDLGYTYRRTRSRLVSGQWREEGGRLILGDLMEILGKEEDKSAVASVTYKRDIITRGLKEKATRGTMVWSTAASKSERETCPTDLDLLGNFAKFKARESRSEIHLKSLANDDVMVLGDIVIKKLELFIEEDGHYYVVVRATVPNAANDRPYIIDSGNWQRLGSSLKFYNGVVRTTVAENQVDLTFTQTLTLFTGTNIYPLAVEGKSVRLVFGKSDLSIDDLTDSYR